MQPPKVGEVWERDGKRREVWSLDSTGRVWWRRAADDLFIEHEEPDEWNRWASKATLVEGSNGGEAAVDH